jgi:hypothetical protein
MSIFGYMHLYWVGSCGLTASRNRVLPCQGGVKYGPRRGPGLWTKAQIGVVVAGARVSKRLNAVLPGDNQLLKYSSLPRGATIPVQSSPFNQELDPDRKRSHNVMSSSLTGRQLFSLPDIGSGGHCCPRLHLAHHLAGLALACKFRWENDGCPERQAIRCVCRVA